MKSQHTGSPSALPDNVAKFVLNIWAAPGPPTLLADRLALQWSLRAHGPCASDGYLAVARAAEA
jgi:hypothetical protein